MKVRRLLCTGLALCTALLVAVGPAWAEGELTLSLNKDIGSRLGNQCQGRFTLSVRGAQDLTSVTYEIDGAPMATVTKAPFSLAFDTGQYPLGAHRLSATAETLGGETLKSNVITVEFISAGSAARIWVPIVAGILLIVILGSVVPALGGRRQVFEPGAVRSYGLAGGTICPRCRRPFAMNAVSPNLVVGTLQRCPYCGKWAVLRRAGREALAAAEAEAVAGAKPQVSPSLSAEEKLRRQIEDSRYQE